MKESNGYYLFGFWEGMPYRSRTDRYEDFLTYKNTIDKSLIIGHIENLEYGLATVMSTDLFTGEKFRAGIYEDGNYRFPVDFLRYYQTRDIGIPYEYEAYLKTILK